MHWDLTPYSFILIYAGFIALLIVLAGWRRRYAPGAGTFMLFMGAVALWSFAYAFELSSHTKTAMLRWATVEYVGIVLVPLAYFVFVHQYLINAHWLTPRRAMWLLIHPLFTLLAVLTNQWHGLFWTESRVVVSGAQFFLENQFGPAFYLHVVYSYTLLMVGSILALRVYVNGSFSQRYQAPTLILGVIPPWIANILTLAGINPIAPVDMTPFAFTLTGGLVLFGLLHFQMLRIAPVARETIVTKLDDAVLVLDGMGRLVDLNPAAEVLLGRSAQDVLGREAGEFLADWPDLVRLLCADGDVQQQICRPGPAPARCYDAQISRLRRGKWRSQGRIAILHDVTEHMATVEALRNQEARLRASMTQLQELDELKSAFIRHMNHELRTPLTNIRLYLSLLAKGNPDKQGHYLDVLQREALSLQSMIETTLDLSRLGEEEPEATLHPQPVVVASLIRAAVDQLEKEAGVAGVELRWDETAAGNGFIMGDEAQLLLVMGNLLRNAINYSHRGDRVHLTVVRDGDRVGIRVRDEGMGITPGEEPYIFDRFYRGPRVAELGIPGVGLGLSIARETVRRHQGDIAVESAPGQGATFTVWFPAAPIDPIAAADPTAHVEAASAPTGEQAIPTPAHAASSRRWHGRMDVASHTSHPPSPRM